MVRYLYLVTASACLVACSGGGPVGTLEPLTDTTEPVATSRVTMSPVDTSPVATSPVTTSPIVVKPAELADYGVGVVALDGVELTVAVANEPELRSRPLI